MKTLQRLQDLKRSLESAKTLMSGSQSDYYMGFADGLNAAIKAIELEIKMVEEGEKA